MRDMDISHTLRAAMAGDRNAFADLVRRYHTPLLGVARSLLRNGEAEEAVQDAWLAAWQHIGNFEGRSALKTWLTRIVLNECRMRLRRSGREINLDLDGAGPDVLLDRFREDGHWHQSPVSWDWHTPEQLLEEQDLQDCLKKNLSRMSAQQRLVLELRDIQGLSLEDICNLLEVSASNVRVLLHRARARLFTVVEHYQETGEC